MIVPSQCYEGFPMTIVESFSLGILVIAGKIGNLQSIIQDGYNGLLFEYNNPKALIESLNKINDKEFNLEKLRAGARETFCTKYEDRENYKILVDIYDSCLGENDGKINKTKA